VSRNPSARRRQSVQRAALVVLLAASAAEVFALSAGLDGLRDVLLVLIALTMVVASAAG
jgi:hypothetical protein